MIQILVWEWYFTWTRFKKTEAGVPFTGNHGVGGLCRGLPWNSAPRPLFWILFEYLRIGDPWFQKTQDKHGELYCFLIPGRGSGISDTTSHWEQIIEEGSRWEPQPWNKTARLPGAVLPILKQRFEADLDSDYQWDMFDCQIIYCSFLKFWVTEWALQIICSTHSLKFTVIQNRKGGVCLELDFSMGGMGIDD